MPDCGTPFCLPPCRTAKWWRLSGVDRSIVRGARTRLGAVVEMSQWKDGSAVDESREPSEAAAQIAAVGGAAVAKNSYVTAIDALLATGWLRPEKVEDWRRGRVPYLERVTVASLPKISTACGYFGAGPRARACGPAKRFMSVGPGIVGDCGSPGRVTRTSSGRTAPTGCRRSPRRTRTAATTEPAASRGQRRATT